MNDMNPRAIIGGNSPPDPIDAISAQYESAREAAETLLEGLQVETEAQMVAVDAIRKEMRQWRLDLERGQKAATAPLYDAYKVEGERWKPTIEDAKRIEGCLVAAVDGFKRKLAAEKAEAERLARAEAERKMREAKAATAAADAANLEAMRAEAEAKREADEAVAKARAASADTVKGLRTVARYEITDHRALLHWIARNDRGAITAFIEEWARKNHKEQRGADGLRVWEEKAAY